MSYEPLTDTQVAEIKSQVRSYLQGAIDEIDVSGFLAERGFNTDPIPLYFKPEAIRMSSEEAVFNPKSALPLFSFHFCFFGSLRNLFFTPETILTGLFVIYLKN